MVERPYSLEAEQATLGCLLCGDEETVNKIVRRLPSSEYFDAPKHRSIYERCLDLHAKHTAIDPVTVGQDLDLGEEFKGVGYSYLIGLVEGNATLTNVEFYVDIVIRKYHERKVIGILARIDIDISAGSTYKDAFVRANEEFVEVGEEISSPDDFRKTEDVTTATIERMDRIISGKEDLGYKSGFKELDRKLTLGTRQVSVWCGDPGMGKSAIMLQIAMNIALIENFPVLYCTYEMSAEDMMMRWLCSAAEVDIQQFKGKDGISSDDWQRILAQKLLLDKKGTFHIDDKGKLTPDDLYEKLSRAKKELGIRVAFVDFLQRGHSPGADSQYESLSALSRNIADMAGELDLHIGVGSQLNRPKDKKPTRPTLIRLKGSSGIEEDAWSVIGIWRQGYHFKDSANPDQKAELHILKQKSGPTGMVELKFQDEYVRFVEKEEVSYDGYQDY